jgi:hypothetical protein
MLMRLSGCMAGKLRRENVKLIIAGGRDFTDRAVLEAIANKATSISGVSEVVYGGARGADACGAFWARDHDIPVVSFPAEWDKYGKSAGYRRNVDMAIYADALLAFWDGESKGTKHMIDIAKDQGLLIKVYNYKGNRIDI